MENLNMISDCIQTLSDEIQLALTWLFQSKTSKLTSEESKQFFTLRKEYLEKQIQTDTAFTKLNRFVLPHFDLNKTQ